MPETYEELLAHYAETRDAEAFRQIVMHHKNMVYAACKRILRNGADAEDATQNCFVALARDPRKVKGSVAGWLHRMATGKSVDIIRRDSARRVREAKTMKNGLREESAAWEDISHALDQAINDLPDELRIPIIRCYLEGYRQEDAAREMGVSQSAVAKRLQRGIETLRAVLRKGGWMGSVTLLATLLASKTSEAAPAALTASLGKLAIAGTTGASTGTAAGGTGIIGGLGAMKIGMLAVAAVAIIAIGIGLSVALHKPDTPPIENIEPHVSEPAEENALPKNTVVQINEESITPGDIPPQSEISEAVSPDNPGLRSMQTPEAPIGVTNDETPVGDFEAREDANTLPLNGIPETVNAEEAESIGTFFQKVEAAILNPIDRQAMVPYFHPDAEFKRLGRTSSIAMLQNIPQDVIPQIIVTEVTLFASNEIPDLAKKHPGDIWNADRVPSKLDDTSWGCFVCFNVQGQGYNEVVFVTRKFENTYKIVYVDTN